MSALAISKLHAPAPILFAALALAGAFQDPKNTTIPRPRGIGDVVDAGSRPAFDAELSDDVPLPERGAGRAGAASDEPAKPATGDPFFIGFVGSNYSPPDGERLDPRIAAAAARLDDSRPGRVVYGFVMFSRRITQARLDELERAGARLLGSHPHHAWKVAAPESLLSPISQLPFVRWVGVARLEQKIHPALARAVAESPAGEHQVWISLFETDLNLASTSIPVGAASAHDADGNNRAIDTKESPVRIWQSRGWQQSALEARGIEIVEYVPSRNAFRARADATNLSSIADLDFVHFVEPVLTNTFADGPSASMVSADVARAWGYNGGNDALAGVIDSGLNIAHEAMGSHYSYGWDVSVFGDSPWIPSDFHGTMVAGGILADPPAGPNAHIRGYAPKLGYAPNARFRVVDAFDTALSQAALFGFMQGNLNDGLGNISPPVHVYNNSYGAGAGAGPWKGTETDALAVDDAVWNHNQVVVFAAHNFGPGAGSVSVQGSSKNALVVGNIPNYFSGSDPGEIATDSGRGPTADGRWKPNVSAPGNGTLTCSYNNNSGYVYGGGTSMAAPHVTGLIAQLADHYSWLRYAPARVASLLMATATTRHNSEHVSPNTTHHNSYGAGRVDAFRSHFTNDAQMKTVNWGFSLNANQGTYADFAVSSAVSRVVVCLHWIEPSPSPGASKAVRNDLDLFIDAPPSIDTILNSGEYTAHQSGVDNTEIRTITNPTPGTWRWKIFPYSAPGGSRVSVSVHLVEAPTKVGGTVNLAASKQYVKPNETVDVTATCSTPDFIANGIFLDTTSNSNAQLLATSTVLKDGPLADLGQCLNSVPANQGLDVTMGSVVHGDPRSVTYQARWSTEGTKAWAVEARCDNWTNIGWFTGITVDGTQPSIVGNLGSSTHTAGVWSKNPNITYNWTAASDALSGIDGYAIKDSASPSAPGFTKNLAATTAFSQTLAPETHNWHFAIRAVDKSQNWSAGYAQIGPFKVDAVAPSAASNLLSTTHIVGAWYANPTITLTWNAASDSASGVAGYIVAFDHSPSSVPVGAIVNPQTTQTVTLPYGNIAWYCHVRSIDVAGNYGPTIHAGPYSIDPDGPAGTAAIDFGAEATADSNVSILLSFSDATSAPKDARFRNDGGSFSPWEPFQTVKSNWSLAAFGGAPHTGTRTVTVEVRDYAGNVTNVNDTIFYHLPILYFGGACAGSGGLPGFAVAGLPGIGKPMTSYVSNTSAGMCYVGWGYSKTNIGGAPLPFDLAILGSPGCQLFISFDGVVAQGPPGATPFLIPNNPAIVNQTFYLQAVLTGDPSGKPLVTTQAAQITIAGP